MGENILLIAEEDRRDHKCSIMDKLIDIKSFTVRITSLIAKFDMSERIDDEGEKDHKV